LVYQTQKLNDDETTDVKCDMLEIVVV